MSLKAVNWAWSIGGLTPAEKLVLVRLADRARDGNYRCWPSVEGLAADCSTCERTARKALRSLERKGLILTVPSPGRSTNSYQLAVANPANAAPLPRQITTSTRQQMPPNPANNDLNPANAAPEAFRSFMNHKAEPRRGRPFGPAAAALPSGEPSPMQRVRRLMQAKTVNRGNAVMGMGGPRCEVCQDRTYPCVDCDDREYRRRQDNGGW